MFGPASLEPTLRVLSFVFLTGIVLVFAGAVPAVTRRWPRTMVAGFVLAVTSLFLVLGAALLLRG